MDEADQKYQSILAQGKGDKLRQDVDLAQLSDRLDEIDLSTGSLESVTKVVRHSGKVRYHYGKQGKTAAEKMKTRADLYDENGRLKP